MIRPQTRKIYLPSLTKNFAVPLRNQVKQIIEVMMNKRPINMINDIYLIIT